MDIDIRTLSQVKIIELRGRLGPGESLDRASVTLADLLPAGELRFFVRSSRSAHDRFQRHWPLGTLPHFRLLRDLLGRGKLRSWALVPDLSDAGAVTMSACARGKAASLVLDTVNADNNLECIARG